MEGAKVFTMEKSQKIIESLDNKSILNSEDLKYQSIWKTY